MNVEHYKLVSMQSSYNLVQVCMWSSRFQMVQELGLDPKPDVQMCINALTYLFR